MQNAYQHFEADNSTLPQQSSSQPTKAKRQKKRITPMQKQSTFSEEMD
jgi:hypothetical protein